MATPLRASMRGGLLVDPRDDPKEGPWYRSGPVNPTTERLEKYMKRAVRFRQGAKRSREILEREERDTTAAIRSHELDVARLKKKANKLEAKRQEAAKEEARLDSGCRSAREVPRLRGIFQLQEPLKDEESQLLVPSDEDEDL